ncbi:Imm70 family immunity protein [Gimesia maris]|uniref:Imm70 family immunity protein n=1 Tax=Gimesia maris TaxID=122 RepID=UPI003A8F814C
MGLYLCVFDEDEELEGVEVGSYSDFEFFRSSVTELLEQGSAGSRFPTLINHADSDGEWSPIECETLKAELLAILEGFHQLPGVQFRAEWQQEVGDALGLEPSSFDDSFIDVDGEPLLDRLVHLCDVAIDRDCPILFQ